MLVAGDKAMLINVHTESSFHKYGISSSNFPAMFDLEDPQQLGHFAFWNNQGIVHAFLALPQKDIISREGASADIALDGAFHAVVGQGRWVKHSFSGALGGIVRH